MAALTCKVGGAKSTFSESLANQIAELIDHAFGAEGDWEGAVAREFGQMAELGLRRLQDQARTLETVANEDFPNLNAIGMDCRTTFLPLHLQPTCFPLFNGEGLLCASLPGLRQELANLARESSWPVEDLGLQQILDHLDSVDSQAEIVAYARLALASNEAVRKDCPLWLILES